ncbi:MAG: sulfotransferase [Gammaproteobacteria bacterium]|nr:sulfotransferase [Gammaproteobacteria bacterium]
MGTTIRSVAEYEYEIGALMRRKDLAGAGLAALACREAWPHVASGWLYGSIAALLADDKISALALVDLWLERHPRDFRCQLQRAECLFSLGRRGEARQAAAAAVEAAMGPPVDVAALDAVGQFLSHAGEQHAAAEAYDRAIAAAPGDPTWYGKRAVVRRYLGDLEGARADHAAVLERAPGEPESLKALADLGAQTRDGPVLDAASAALAAVPADSPAAITLHFALAKALDDLGRHAESWDHLLAANRLERARFRYESSLDRNALEHIAAAYPEAETSRPDSTGERPIFIVGLPRSGTTLLERIVSGHSQVDSAGELSALSNAMGLAVDRLGGAQPANWLEYADALPNVEEAWVAREYLARARPYRGDRPRFIDKMPMNFVYLAAIFRAFPQARVLHLTRHPLAVSYAIFKTRFSQAYPFAYDLGEIAEYLLGYRQLMRHWHRVLPGRILDVAYEDLVGDLEKTTRGVLAYLDLPFESACLEFHRNPSAVTTASAIQVRQPLYDRSLEHWRHYAEWLAPVRERLERAGVDVERR